MVRCLELARKMLKGEKVKCEAAEEIDRGIVMSFTDTKTERRYRVQITEVTEALAEDN